MNELEKENKRLRRGIRGQFAGVVTPLHASIQKSGRMDVGMGGNTKFVTQP
ncbi:MAG: hypothetical protein Tsb0024_13160 [Ruegeria sp.]